MGSPHRFGAVPVFPETFAAASHMFEFIKIVRWQDVVDILVVALLCYQLISIIRGTRSVQMVIGLAVLVGLRRRT